jgi:hypothetical protein
MGLATLRIVEWHRSLGGVFVPICRRCYSFQNMWILLAFAVTNQIANSVRKFEWTVLVCASAGRWQHHLCGASEPPAGALSIPDLHARVLTMCRAPGVFFLVWCSCVGFFRHGRWLCSFVLPRLLYRFVVCYWYIFILGECGECVSLRYLTMVSVKM